MSVYNSPLYLKEAIESVLKQTTADFEFLIINNGSTDNSADIIEEYSSKDERIRVLNHEHSDLGDALNFGLKSAKHEWVFRMDADDLMYPSRLERQLHFIGQHPKLKVTSCRGIYIDHQGHEAGITGLDVLSAQDCKRYVEQCEAIGLLHPGVALHRQTALTLGGYRSQFYPAEDIDLWNRIAEQGHLVFGQDEVLMYYRLHVSSDIASNYFGMRDKFDWVRDCMRRRRTSQEELCWEDFQNVLKSQPLLKRLNRKRKGAAKFFFRQAGLNFISSNQIQAGIRLCAAATLQPDYVMQRLWGLAQSRRNKKMPS